MSPPRNLLLCFDAFGTLFKPRYPIAQQYGDVARSLGLTGFTNEDVQKSFKTGVFELIRHYRLLAYLGTWSLADGATRAAFKQESAQNPNYGKQNGLNAEKWWSRIIVNTFKPLVKPDQDLPPDLVPKLLHRFWSDEGYELYPDAVPLVRRVREVYHARGAKVVIGVITNSDDRVPDVLTSLGMRVSTLRFPGKELVKREGVFDIDFSVMSYDVGCEKPDKRIFEAADLMHQTVLGKEDVDGREWRKIYVGDEYAKDVVGAVEAGWIAILIERETSNQTGVKWLDQEPVGSLYEIFEREKAVGFRSLDELAAWLPRES